MYLANLPIMILPTRLSRRFPIAIRGDLNAMWTSLSLKHTTKLTLVLINVIHNNRLYSELNYSMEHLVRKVSINIITVRGYYGWGENTYLSYTTDSIYNCGQLEHVDYIKELQIGNKLLHIYHTRLDYLILEALGTETWRIGDELIYRCLKNISWVSKVVFETGPASLKAFR